MDSPCAFLLYTLGEYARVTRFAVPSKTWRAQSLPICREAVVVACLELLPPTLDAMESGLPRLRRLLDTFGELPVPINVDERW